MSTTLVPAGFAVLLWWASTGLALLAVGRAEERSRLALAGSALLLAGSLAVLGTTRDDPTALAQYLAFTAAIGVWGAAEIAFLTGWLTGPWTMRCPAGATGWLRAGYALSAILWHEVSLLACGAAVAAATWAGSNTIGLWSFAALLAMRISAKLNLFLGVPNVTEDFLPRHLAHLTSFFAKKPMNWLFPVSVTLSTIALVLLVQEAGSAGDAASVGLVLLATLVFLGLVEHWFLVLPIRVEALWAWSLVPPPAAPELAPDLENDVVVRLHPHLVARTAAASEPPFRPIPLRAGRRHLPHPQPDQAGASP